MSSTKLCHQIVKSPNSFFKEYKNINSSSFFRGGGFNWRLRSHWPSVQPFSRKFIKNNPSKEKKLWPPLQLKKAAFRQIINFCHTDAAKLFFCEKKTWSEWKKQNRVENHSSESIVSGIRIRIRMVAHHTPLPAPPAISIGTVDFTWARSPELELCSGCGLKCQSEGPYWRSKH